ncbi:MAG TPA: hypothetical protein VM076_04840 [Gemmatimonadaceae bacterium]|nr:hypothetical protein [Gemmatimonadaceae bacterium]
MARDAGIKRSLRFSSLEEDRFVDLVAALLYPSADWVELRRSDRRATASQFDIVARESLGDLLVRSWAVKTVRDDHVSADQRMAIVRQCLRAHPRVPDVFLLVLTTDVAESVRDQLLRELAAAGVTHAMVWARQELEAQLYNERPDLLFTYFGVTSFKRTRRTVRTLRRRIAIKRRLQKAFIKPVGERDDVLVQPYDKLRYPKVVVRSIDDHSYPSADHRLGHIRGWMEVGTYDFYYDGVEVILGTTFVLVDDAGAWSPVSLRQSFDATRYRRVRAFEIGRIPFTNIVTFDVDGDEYHAEPHVFCAFANAGLPFADYRYYAVEAPYRDKLLPDRMIDLGGPQDDLGRQLGIVGR